MTHLIQWETLVDDLQIWWSLLTLITHYLPFSLSFIVGIWVNVSTENWLSCNGNIQSLKQPEYEWVEQPTKGYGMLCLLAYVAMPIQNRRIPFQIIWNASANVQRFSCSLFLCCFSSLHGLHWIGAFLLTPVCGGWVNRWINFCSIWFAVANGGVGYWRLVCVHFAWLSCFVLMIPGFQH